VKKTLILAAFMIVAATSTSFAVSCTTQGQTCQAWARGQGNEAAGYIAACKAEVPACISRCKGGTKAFIGVSRGAGGGQHYPIDECK
jgi:hypothetical protein